MSKMVGILLAAGSSSRFGSNKLLHSLPDGTAIGVAAARNLQEALSNSIAVVPQGDLELRKAFSNLGMRVVDNPLASHGMSTSIVAGINASTDADGWVIALADMPWVKPETIRLLVEALKHGSEIVVPEYGGKRGNPVGFASKWKDPLCSLSADKGARNLIKSHAREVMRINVVDNGVLRDIDILRDVENTF